MENINTLINEKIEEHKNKVLSSIEYKNEIIRLENLSKDYINTLRLISLYSTRSNEIYTNYLNISIIDELLESAVNSIMLIKNGSFNIVKRELRYLLELEVKFSFSDYNDNNKVAIDDKLEYFVNEIPRSSIDIIRDFNLPLSTDMNEQFKKDVINNYSNLCEYIHPSKKQYRERLNNYAKGQYIGFESVAMIRKVNDLVFRSYDMILFLQLYCFGFSMSKDILELIISDFPKWKFLKGKYVGAYIETLNLA